MSTHILVVEDDSVQRSDLAEIVRSFGYQVTTAGDGLEALSTLARLPASAILTDLMMPRMDGIALLKELAARGDRTPTVVLTGFGSIDQAISVVHDLKAFWFLEKPLQPGVVRTLLERAVQQNRLAMEAERLNSQLSYQGVLGDLVGDSMCMKEIFSLIRQVAPTTASVLISGESGTGKELVARAIHTLSRRSTGPFVAVNCAALPESLMESELFGHEKGAFTGANERRIGRFEQADGGTLFLDEIGEIDATTQVKLLRVLGERTFERVGANKTIAVDVRLIAATNKPLPAMVKAGTFREDLYFRLRVVELWLPPLRERPGDVPLLALHFLKEVATEYGRPVTDFTVDALQALMNYAWPANVRELRNAIEGAVALCRGDKITLRDLPPNVRGAALAIPAAGGRSVLEQPTLTLEEAERQLIIRALQETKGNRTLAAKNLGVSRRTLHRKLHVYHLEGF